MKILHINSYYINNGRPGFYKNLYEKQIKQGLDIAVFTPTDQDFNIEYFGSYCRVIKTFNKIDRFFFHLKQFKIWRSLSIAYEKKEEFDLIHAHSLFTNGYPAFILNKMFKIPYIVAVRDTDLNLFFKKIVYLRPLGVKILLNASRIIFLSDTYKDKTFKNFIPEKYHERLAKKVEVIPNGIDSFWLDNKNPSPPSIKENKVDVIYVGQISKRKNLLPAVKACQILHKSGYEVTYTVVGEIKSASEYNRIREYNFVRHIRYQQKEDLIQIYRNNNIFVMPSRTETFGLVYAEALTQGLPVIYSKGQGFDGQFKEGIIGYGVDCNDEKDISEKLIEIINNYDQIAGNCLLCCEKFDWDIISEYYLNIYANIINLSVNQVCK